MFKGRVFESVQEERLVLAGCFSKTKSSTREHCFVGSRSNNNTENLTGDKREGLQIEGLEGRDCRGRVRRDFFYRRNKTTRLHCATFSRI